MLSERMLTGIVKNITKSHLIIDPTTEKFLPGPEPGRKYMLYLHVPFCEVLCPYCSFNRYAFREDVARPYFEHMRREMLMVKELGYDIESIYCGGGMMIHAPYTGRTVSYDSVYAFSCGGCPV